MRGVKVGIEVWCRAGDARVAGCAAECVLRGVVQSRLLQSGTSRMGNSWLVQWDGHPASSVSSMLLLAGAPREGAGRGGASPTGSVEGLGRGDRAPGPAESLLRVVSPFVEAEVTSSWIRAGDVPSWPLGPRDPEGQAVGRLLSPVPLAVNPVRPDELRDQAVGRGAAAGVGSVVEDVNDILRESSGGSVDDSAESADGSQARLGMGRLEVVPSVQQPIHRVDFGGVVAAFLFQPQAVAAKVLARLLADVAGQIVPMLVRVVAPSASDGVPSAADEQSAVGIVDAVVGALREYSGEVEAGGGGCSDLFKVAVQNVEVLVDSLFGSSARSCWRSMAVSSSELASDCEKLVSGTPAVGVAPARKSQASAARVNLAEAFFARISFPELALGAVDRLLAVFGRKVPVMYQNIRSVSGGSRWTPAMATAVQSCVLTQAGFEEGSRVAMGLTDADLSSVGFTQCVTITKLSKSFWDLCKVHFTQQDGVSCGYLCLWQLVGAGIVTPSYVRKCVVDRVMTVMEGARSIFPNLKAAQAATKAAMVGSMAPGQVEADVETIFHVLVGSGLPGAGILEPTECKFVSLVQSETDGRGLDELFEYAFTDFGPWSCLGIVRLAVCSGNHWMGLYRRPDGSWLKQDSMLVSILAIRSDEEMGLLRGRSVGVIMIHPKACIKSLAQMQDLHRMRTGLHMPWVDVPDTGKVRMMLGPGEAPTGGAVGRKRGRHAARARGRTPPAVPSASRGGVATPANQRATVPPVNRSAGLLVGGRVSGGAMGAGLVRSGGAAGPSSGFAAPTPGPVPAKVVGDGVQRGAYCCGRDCRSEGALCVYCWTCKEYQIVCYKRGVCANHKKSRKLHHAREARGSAVPVGYPSVRTHAGRELLATLLAPRADLREPLRVTFRAGGVSMLEGRANGQGAPRAALPGAPVVDVPVAAGGMGSSAAASVLGGPTGEPAGSPPALVAGIGVALGGLAAVTGPSVAGAAAAPNPAGAGDMTPSPAGVSALRPNGLTSVSATRAPAVAADAGLGSSTASLQNVVEAMASGLAAMRYEFGRMQQMMMYGQYGHYGWEGAGPQWQGNWVPQGVPGPYQVVQGPYQGATGPYQGVPGPYLPNNVGQGWGAVPTGAPGTM